MKNVVPYGNPFLTATFCLLAILSISFSCASEEEDLPPSEGQPQAFKITVDAFRASINSDQIDYSLEIIAKDHALGTIKWNTKIDLSAHSTIEVPPNYGHYSFIATRMGDLPHVQHFLGKEVSNGMALKFEFIPESLEGFTVEEYENGAIKIYWPSDGNRCKLYARIDFAEGYLVDYVYADKAASAITGVLGLVFKEYFSPPFSASSFGNNVNLFDNINFGNASNYCDEIDLTISNATSSLDDVNLESFVYIGYFKPGISPISGNQVMIYPFQEWKGANNP